jgi:hypothetical protein
MGSNPVVDTKILDYVHSQDGNLREVPFVRCGHGIVVCSRLRENLTLPLGWVYSLP